MKKISRIISCFMIMTMLGGVSAGAGFDRQDLSRFPDRAQLFAQLLPERRPVLPEETLPPEEEIPEENGVWEEKQSFTLWSLEAENIGHPYLIEPVKMAFEDGETAAQVFVRFLQQAGFDYEATGTVQNGFYLKAIKDGSSSLSLQPQISPELDGYLTENMSYYDKNAWTPGRLGEFDFTNGSGWLIYKNGQRLGNGMSQINLNDGDEIRLRFTLNYGQDLQ